MRNEAKQRTARLFWELAAELTAADPDVAEGTIMNGRCLRVGREFLALVDYKGSGLVVKLSKDRVAELVGSGAGQAFAPAGRVFKEWLSVFVQQQINIFIDKKVNILIQLRTFFQSLC